MIPVRLRILSRVARTERSGETKPGWAILQHLRWGPGLRPATAGAGLDVVRPIRTHRTAWGTRVWSDPLEPAIELFGPGDP